MSGYKYYVKERMAKFMASMKEPIDGMWLWEELGLKAYTRDLWEGLTEDRKEEYNRLYVEREIFEALKRKEKEEEEEAEKEYREVSTQTD
jgi:hypothetical protein